MLVWLLVFLLLVVISYVVYRVLFSTDEKNTKNSNQHYTFKI
jgi:hypothetical protein